MNEEVVYCSRCGHPTDTLYDVEGDLVCRDCMERDSFVLYQMWRALLGGS